MLIHLQVRNLGIVAQAEVDFCRGLNIVTGETGAGKSLLIDALSIIRGGKFLSSMVGPFDDCASVIAEFEVPQSDTLSERLDRWGLKEAADQGILVLRRVCHPNGRTRNFISDTPVHLRTLIEIASELVDISAQFANQRLLDERTHVDHLDTFGKIDDERKLYEMDFNECLKLLGEYSSLQKQRLSLGRERALITAELDELESLCPSQEDYEATREFLAQSETSAKLGREISIIADKLSHSENGLLVQLSSIRKGLFNLSQRFSNEISPSLSQLADTAALATEDLSFELEKKLDAWGRDASERQSQRLAWETRLDIYLSLSAKYGVGVHELENYLSYAKERLRGLEALEDNLAAIEHKLVPLIHRTSAKARALTKLRESFVVPLAKAIEGELAALGMEKARFRIELEKQETCAPLLLPHVESIKILASKDQDVTELLELSRTGAERARFVIAPNPGSPGGPLREIASGGELSRLMLSIKKVLFAKDTMSVFVFDEIDTGISGAVASRVGLKLAEFCEHRQAIVVTHLPQVACHAHQHFEISKTTRNGQTQTQIRSLDPTQSEKEIAKMLSGLSLSPESLAQARRLLDDAKKRPPRKPKKEAASF